MAGKRYMGIGLMGRTHPEQIRIETMPVAVVSILGSSKPALKGNVSGGGLVRLVGEDHLTHPEKRFWTFL